MTATTPGLRLPLLSAGQAQKELVHNEALLQIDAALTPIVKARDALAAVAIEVPVGGSVIDTEARAAIAAILDGLRGLRPSAD